MIVTQTPFRISFAGGGTDLKEFYEKEQGTVLSTTIKKYMYIAVNRQFEDNILLKYARTELIKDAQEIQHPLIRQCFLKTKNKMPLEMASFADIPSSGTGLGSSSAFTVGLLKALYTALNENKENHTLAKEACEIEIDELKEPIGKQDQYACALGGLNVIRFNPDGSVAVEPIKIPDETKKALEDNLVLFYTGITRQSRTILTEQKKETLKQEKWLKLCKMRDLVFELRDALTGGDLSSFGEILNKGWLLKKEIASGISNDIIDAYYKKALESGATGGKLLGAGGGGFLLLYCDKDKQQKLRESLPLREIKFAFDPEGSRIVYLGGHEI